MRFRRPTNFGLIRMLLFGASFGTLFDGFHTHSGSTAYPDPVFWLMAWWVPFLFAGAYSLLGIGYFLASGVDDSVGRNERPIPGALVFAGLYFLSGYLPATNAIKLMVLLVGAAGLWLLLDRRAGTLVLGVIAAIAGPSFEMLLVRIGAFAHLQPDFAGIPMWLPALYLASAVGIAPFMAWLGYGQNPIGSADRSSMTSDG